MEEMYRALLETYTALHDESMSGKKDGNAKREKKWSMILACTPSGGIGRGGQIPWHLPLDMEFFQRITSHSTNAAQTVNAVLMGRRTWESIPSRFRPLPNRVNIVLTKNPQEIAKINQEYREQTMKLAVEVGGKASSSVPVAHACASLQEAESYLRSKSALIEQVFVIGGASLYHECIQLPQCERVFLTSVLTEFPDCDAFFDRAVLAKAGFRELNSDQTKALLRDYSTGLDTDIVQRVIDADLQLDDKQSPLRFSVFDREKAEN